MARDIESESNSDAVMRVNLPRIVDGYIAFYKYEPKCPACGTVMKMRGTNQIACPACKKRFDCKYIYLN